jgi:hypothetical protein
MVFFIRLCPFNPFVSVQTNRYGWPERLSAKARRANEAHRAAWGHNEKVRTQTD